MFDHFRHIVTTAQDNLLIIKVKAAELREYVVAQELAGEMTSAVDESGCTNVILDLENVVMFTSAALLPLLGLRSSVKRHAGELVLCNLSDAVAQALTVSQLIVENRNHKAHLQLASDIASAVSMLQPANH